MEWRRFIMENPEAWLEQRRAKRPKGVPPGKVVCPECGSPHIDFISSLNRYECKKCRRLFS